MLHIGQLTLTVCNGQESPSSYAPKTTGQGGGPEGQDLQTITEVTDVLPGVYEGGFKVWTIVTQERNFQQSNFYSCGSAR